MKKRKTIEEIKGDYHLFIDLQMNKYFLMKGKKAFDSEEEAKRIIGEIINAYNSKIASEHKNLDTFSESEKINWFNSIEVKYYDEDSAGHEQDFIGPSVLNFKNGQNEIKPDMHLKLKPDENSLESLENIIKHYNNLLYFLPEGAISVLIFAGPALKAYGYPAERFNKIIEGTEPTEIEKDLLLWAYDLTMGVSFACLEKNKIKKRNYMERAKKIAREELDEKTGAEVVLEIYSAIQEEVNH